MLPLSNKHPSPSQATGSSSTTNNDTNAQENLSHINAKTLDEIKALGLEVQDDLDVGCVEEALKNLKYHKKMADEGHVSAYHQIGLIYLSGYAFVKDTKRALNSFIEGATKGSPECCYQIAHMFDQGFFGKEDRYSSLQWNMKGACLANANNPNSRVNMYHFNRAKTDKASANQLLEFYKDVSITDLVNSTKVVK